ncbi:MAG: YbhB/YbcL family Raf kinase inhibitor-like protein [Gammaproteobacteria bacterium]|nr:YbhB/YbcL family Raf kinase inhibitor-like protein [Gammaproteobacteria bacterium]
MQLAKIILFTFVAIFSIGAYAMELISPAFDGTEFIPTKYCCDGQNISPPVQWKNPPKNTKSFVLILDDPDSPSGNWVHWMIYNIPANINSLPENISTLPAGAIFGLNSWNEANYKGPCPPSGTHRYFLQIFALDIKLETLKKATRNTIENAMHGHVIAEASLTGKYHRQ